MFSSQSSQSLYPSPRFSLFRGSSPRPRSAAALTPQLCPSLCPDRSSDESLSSTRPFLHQPFVASSCSLTEQNESKKRLLFSHTYKGTNLQLLYSYTFTKIGGRFLRTSIFIREGIVTSLPLYFAASISSHGTIPSLPRLHRCRGELHA